jgi:hypothetical protein
MWQIWSKNALFHSTRSDTHTRGKNKVFQLFISLRDPSLSTSGPDCFCSALSIRVYRPFVCVCAPLELREMMLSSASGARDSNTHTPFPSRIINAAVKRHLRRGYYCISIQRVAAIWARPQVGERQSARGWCRPWAAKPFISGSGVIYENFASYQRDVKKLRLNKWLNVLSAAEWAAYVERISLERNNISGAAP